MSFVLNMDRTNLSNAVSDNMALDLGFNNDGVNFSIMVYSFLFTLFTFPSNIMVKKMGAHKWIPCLILSWGTDYFGFLIVRIFIAITEAGFIPACLVYLTGWYKTNELGTRLAYFWGIQAFASAFSGILSSMIFHLRGYWNMPGWKWLFFVDGVITIIIGCIAFAYLPASPLKTKGQLRGLNGWFTERETSIAMNRILLDDATKKDQNKSLTWADVKITLLDYNLHIHLLITFFGLMAETPIKTYLPSMIHSYGFPVSQANLLATPPILIGLVCTIYLAKSSEKKRKGQVVLHCLVSPIWSLLGFLMFYLVPESLNAKWLLYFISLFTAASPYFHPLSTSWISSNMSPTGKRSLALAANIAFANINSFFGAMIYQTKDAPRYYHGNLVCIFLQFITIGLMLYQRYRYIKINKERKRIWYQMTETEKEVYKKTTLDQGNDRLDHVYYI
ncbi:major facilitator superfamily domain-containing protein [Cunninghamella echinulata]|nr:major facilitator superfamily domain-containing protein [Cunninghamella echinulata]